NGVEDASHRPRERDLAPVWAEHDLRRRHISWRPLKPARWAGPLAHVREYDPGVNERGLAARAAGRAADGLGHHPAPVRMVDTEEDRLRIAPQREVRDDRIVRAQAERGA